MPCKGPAHPFPSDFVQGPPPLPEPLDLALGEAALNPRARTCPSRFDYRSQEPRSCRTIRLHQGTLYAQALFIGLFDNYSTEIHTAPSAGSKDGGK